MTNQNSSSQSQTIFEHIRAFRYLVIWMIVSFLVSVSVIHYFREQIIYFLLRPLGEETPMLQFLSPLDPLYFILKLDFTLGFLLSLPVIGALLWHFVSPAIELRRWWIPYALASSILLLSGSAFAYSYVLVMPLLLAFLSTLAVPGTQTAFTAHGYLSFFLSTTAILILVFQIPLLLCVSIGSKLIKPATIKKNRPYLYIGAVIASAVITPTTDVFSLALVALPCILAIEVGTFFGSLFFIKREKGT